MTSVFTPTHKPSKLIKAFESLKTQTDQDFEWVVLINNTTDLIPPEIKDYKKIKLVYDYTGRKEIGYLKHQACVNCVGNIIVELDHDDAFEPNCIQVLVEAFKDETIDFAYSSCYEYRDGVNIKPFDESYGWRYSNSKDGRIITHAFPPSPVSVSYIWYAPNHVRAWKKSFYDFIKGHNEMLDVCDDHEICIRTYLDGKMKFIDQPLYQYHVTTGDSTCYGDKNAKIQQLTIELHDQFIEPLCLKWSTLNNLQAIDLCCHTNKRKGFIGVDRHPYEGVDIVCDLDKTWDIKDNSVGIFRLQDAIEHMKDPIHTMKELYRCLAPGGFALIEVPSTDGRGAFQDPTHVSFWNSNSFWYYTDSTAKYINTPVKFQLNRIENYFPSDWHKLHNILYTRAHLMKLQDGVVPAGGRKV